MNTIDKDLAKFSTETASADKGTTDADEGATLVGVPAKDIRNIPSN